MTLFLSQLIFKPRAACALLRRPFSFSLLNHVGPSSKILQTRSFLLQISPRTSRLTFATPTHPQNSRVSPNCRRWLSSTFRASYRYRSPPPPSRTPKFLGFLNRIPQNVVFVGIISINALVFSMWLLAKAKYTQEGDPSAIIWMKQNFTSSWRNLTSGRIYTPLTACFSHADWSHILFNGFTFFFMARPVLEILGSRQFIFLYIGAGLVSSFSSVLYAKATGKVDFSSHGASGAIYSIVTLLACVAPKMTFQIYGIIPVPAWLAVTGFLSYDLYRSVYAPSGTTDTVGHVGGILSGVTYFLLKHLRIF